MWQIPPLLPFFVSERVCLFLKNLYHLSWRQWLKTNHARAHTHTRTHTHPSVGHKPTFLLRSSFNSVFWGGWVFFCLSLVSVPLYLPPAYSSSPDCPDFLRLCFSAPPVPHQVGPTPCIYNNLRSGSFVCLIAVGGFLWSASFLVFGLFMNFQPRTFGLFFGQLVCLDLLTFHLL